MSVLIKGMDMPDRCLKCPFMVSRDNDDCILLTEEENLMFESFEQLKEHCPLVEVPTPHGRLIDADALKKAVFHHLSIKGEEYLLPAEKSVFGNIIKAPTVIEAEEE